MHSFGDVHIYEKHREQAKEQLKRKPRPFPTVKIDKKTALELKQKLLSLDIPRLKDRQIIKIVDMLPEDIEELRAVFTGEVTTITQENLEKIVEAVKPFVQKQKPKK